MKFCAHKYEIISKPQHLKYDYSGVEVLTALCKCKICGKTKQRKFFGHIVGQLGG